MRVGREKMTPREKRKHPRVETNNLFSQTSLDDQGRCLSQGMGKALDVSQTGLKLETAYPVEGHRISLMTSAMDDRLIEIAGIPLYCIRVESGFYHTGIEFSGSKEAIREFAAELVRLHQHRKHDTFFRLSE
jgi:hypothetical protein